MIHPLQTGTGKWTSSCTQPAAPMRCCPISCGARYHNSRLGLGRPKPASSRVHGFPQLSRSTARTHKAGNEAQRGQTDGLGSIDEDLDFMARVYGLWNELARVAESAEDRADLELGTGRTATGLLAERLVPLACDGWTDLQPLTATAEQPLRFWSLGYRRGADTLALREDGRICWWNDRVPERLDRPQRPSLGWSGSRSGYPCEARAPRSSSRHPAHGRADRGRVPGGEPPVRLRKRGLGDRRYAPGGGTRRPLQARPPRAPRTSPPRPGNADVLEQRTMSSLPCSSGRSRR